tara:strand:+ start:526 stop:744 length:219 start_codon:yes stop_codon:yes gene_type:complete
MKKTVYSPDGVEEIELTSEEITQKENETAKAEEEKIANDNAIAERQALKDSAKAKLVAGEPLTEEEADTIVL